MDRLKKLNILCNQYDENKKLLEKSIGDIVDLELRARELQYTAEHADVMIEKIDKEFAMVTKLNATDIKFLFVAVAIQCIRQYFIGTITQRTDHNKSDKAVHEFQKKIWGSDNDPKKIKEYRENGRKYYATNEEIMNSFSVPYDVMNGTRKFGVGGKDLGLSGKNHRNKTLGHDPLFGWVFGTSNIMTNTLTNDKGITFHVKNSAVVSNGSFDKTARMFAHVSERSKDNPEDLGICIIKQGLHLASDTYSKAGIVLPGTVKLDSNLARNLADYGVDFGNTINAGVNTSISVLINQIIAMIHGMLYDESVEDGRNIYAVRTRKILLYSNCIANMSNIIAVACGTAVGVVTDNAALTKKSLNYLDIGGLIVTIHRIVSDKKFIAQVKQEFLENHWYEEISNIGRNGKIYE